MRKSTRFKFTNFSQCHKMRGLVRQLINQDIAYQQRCSEELTVEEKYKDGDHYEAGKTILTIKCLF